MADTQDLLFEIGTEEVPARMLARALAELPAQATAALAAARLTHGDVRVVGAPRRLALLVSALATRQPDLRERVVGPPAGAAFRDGAPTQAAIGFAQKNGVDPSALTLSEVAGKKGQYVVAERFVAGGDTRALLPDLLLGLLTGIAWPKSMRWGWADEAFVRPVQWMVALLGAEVVPVRWRGVEAGRVSRGHRFLAPGPVELAAPADYEAALRRAHVVVDPRLRRELIAAELTRVERDTGLRVRPDDELLAEVTNLVEYPVAIVGEFDRSFLEVPAEIIVTAMRTHQRYFALEDAAGALANRFVTIAGTIVRDPAQVVAGNARVLAARLADAKFFFAEDRKHSFDDWNGKLAKVVFQAKFGEQAKTTGAKIARITAIVDALATRLGVDAGAAVVAHRAAALCKADLASGVVGEFPELQGIMGMHYARAALAAELGGQADVVARAIAEHYQPKGQGAPVPPSLAGALVALADRVDSLVGCFAVGLEPSGSADPYGLRRAAIGVLSILLDRGPGGAGHQAGAGWPLPFDALAEAAIAAYGATLVVPVTARESLDAFVKGRLRGLLVEEGLAALDVDAALGAGWREPCDARLRARDLAVVPGPAREVFKRIANILDDAAGKGIAPAAAVDPARFVATGNAEHGLWDALRGRQDRIAQAVAARRYRDLFAVLVELQPAVSAFFERGDKGGVMVMDPDPAVRANRLALLSTLLEPFRSVADFRLLAAGGAS